jgi:hypothetical protein
VTEGEGERRKVLSRAGEVIDLGQEDRTTAAFADELHVG